MLYKDKNFLTYVILEKIGKEGMHLENTERRRLILQKLRSTDTSVTGRELAELCRVSRQIIVSDIAMLRAEGARILATSQGYLIEKDRKSETMEIPLYCPDRDALRRELDIIVDNGGMIRGVSVEYGLYGKISCALDLCSRRDIRKWHEELDAQKLQPLSMIAGGKHSFYVEMENAEAGEEILRLLKEAGYLREETHQSEEA